MVCAVEISVRWFELLSHSFWVAQFGLTLGKGEAHGREPVGCCFLGMLGSDFFRGVFCWLKTGAVGFCAFCADSFLHLAKINIIDSHFVALWVAQNWACKELHQAMLKMTNCLHVNRYVKDETQSMNFQVPKFHL